MGFDKNNKEKDKVNSYAEILEAIAHAPIEKRAMTNLGVLNEAYAYAKPSSFARGMRIDIGGVCILMISGTASIDENGVSVHIGDFSAQLRRTFDNITGLLESEGATWHDIVRTSCYLRDIDRDYAFSMRGARRSSRSRVSIRCRRRREFRRICAGRSC
jgi:enamine deaminase RidA (YjgF/YER057c/UK114 family)